MSINKAGFVSWADEVLLGPITDEPPIDPQVLIYHIIVGSASGALAVFKPQGYYGEESTFIVCGPLDQGHYRDGQLLQLQSIKRQADAQFAGNLYANSAETSGFPNQPLSSEQLHTLIRLTAEWCEDTKSPCKMVPRTGPIGEGGLGWHEWRDDWNLTNHVCPGAVREGQLRQIVIPKARARLEGREEPHTIRPNRHVKAHVDADGIFGTETIGAMQHDLKHHGFYKGEIDGIFGPATRTALKHYLKRLGFKLRTDSPDFGSAAVRALETHVHVRSVGRWDHACTRHLQRALNDGRF